MATRYAKIITTFNEKGGSGKTTLSCQLANTLAKRGFRVKLADLDPQMTSAGWAAMGAKHDAAKREELAADGKEFKDDHKRFLPSVWSDASQFGAYAAQELRKEIENYDFIVADCAPSVDQPSTWGMLLVSDLALIPTRLSPPDLQALKTAKRLVRRVLEERGSSDPLPVRVVANAVRMHMKEDKSYLRDLQADKDFPALQETLGDRRAYQRSMLAGSSVHAVPENKEAVLEVEALADRVLQLLGMGRSTVRKAVAA